MAFLRRKYPAAKVNHGIRVDRGNAPERFAFSGNPDDFITLFADASHCPETKVAGIAYWVKFGAEGITLTSNKTLFNIPDCIVAEQAALDFGLKVIAARVPFEDKVLVIQSDCIPALSKVAVPFERKLRLLRRKHVRGHMGGGNSRSHVNELCDAKAKEAMRVGRELKLKGQHE